MVRLTDASPETLSHPPIQAQRLIGDVRLDEALDEAAWKTPSR